MSGAHAQLLAPHGRLHDLPGAHKIAATTAWVVLVTFTPRDAFWAFAAHALCVVGVIAYARLPVAHVARRLAIEVPFVAFACALPIIGRGERIGVLGVSLSERGLWAMWAILAKGTLGVAASIVLAATTPVSELLRGLERLRVPTLFVSISGFMVRYSDVLLDELRKNEERVEGLLTHIRLCKRSPNANRAKTVASSRPGLRHTSFRSIRATVSRG